MASLVYNKAKQEIADGALDLDTDTKVKVMLVNSGYTPDADHEVVDAGGASDPIDAEIVATNYTGGYGGAGRLALATRVVNLDLTNDRAEFDADDLTWTSLGGATNDTIVAAIIIKEDHLGATGNDTETRLIAYVDVADTTTNGGDFTIQWNAEGILQFA